MTERPAIPADLRRRVLVEAGHRCAIPTCRHIDVDVHHIIDWAQCQAHEYNNLIALCPNCHRRAGKGEIDRKSQRLYKANLRFTHDRFSQIEVDVLFDAFRIGPDQALRWPPMLNILLRRLLEVRYIEIRPNRSMTISVGGIDHSPHLLTITDLGRQFVEDLGLHEL